MREGDISNWHTGDITKWRLQRDAAHQMLCEIGNGGGTPIAQGHQRTYLTIGCV